MQRILLMAIMLLPGIVGAASDFRVSNLQSRNEAVAVPSPVFPKAELCQPLNRADAQMASGSKTALVQRR